jgi:hypothetical protein
MKNTVSGKSLILLRRDRVFRESHSEAAPGGMALSGGDNRVHEFLGRTLGTRLAPAFRRGEQAVLALDQDVVKVQ